MQKIFTFLFVATILVNCFGAGEAHVDLEEGSYFEGDLRLTSDQESLIRGSSVSDYRWRQSGLARRVGTTKLALKWPKNRYNKVIVPYVIHKQSAYTAANKKKIRAAMDGIEFYTCVRFEPRSDQDFFLFIHSGKGCSSPLGKIGGGQPVSLDKWGCLHKGKIQHELLHSLGFAHMHNHPDRDKYVEINYSHMGKARSQFAVVDPELFENFGTPYDYRSVMHYKRDAFSDEGLDTIIPKDRNFLNLIGQREGVSTDDVRRINLMYGCREELKYFDFLLRNKAVNCKVEQNQQWENREFCGNKIHYEDSSEEDYRHY